MFSDPRFGSVLIMTPEGCSLYSHTRVLRKRAAAVFELNFLETLKRIGIAETLNLISRIISERKIGIFFVSLYGDSYLLPPEFLRALRRRTKVVLWCWDDDVHFDSHSKYYAPEVDAVVTTDVFSLDAYKRLGVPAILSLGNFSKDLYPAADLARDIDVSFVGNCAKADRKQYMDFLRDHGIKVEGFGFGTHSGFIPTSEMCRVFSRSKINLNFSRLEHVGWIHGDNPPAARTMGHKGRPIEIAMTRSFCLSESYPALPRVFETGSEIDCFTDKASLLEKVRYYLAHDAKRGEIAGRAHLRALREYEDETVFDRLEAELMRAFDQPPPRQLALDGAPEFARRRVNDLIVHGLSLLLGGRLRGVAPIIPELLRYGPGTLLRGAAGGLARSLDILRRKYCNPPA